MPPETPPSPPADHVSPEAVAAFVKRWSEAALSERANYVSFLKELCALLDLPQPDPAVADDSRNAYVFERAVPFHDEKTGQTSIGFIDLYKRGCFTRVVALNAERAAEEAKGRVRYLRPKYQPNPPLRSLSANWPFPRRLRPKSLKTNHGASQRSCLGQRPSPSAPKPSMPPSPPKPSRLLQRKSPNASPAPKPKTSKKS